MTSQIGQRAIGKKGIVEKSGVIELVQNGISIKLDKGQMGYFLTKLYGQKIFIFL
jgi:hypothetical protein